MNQISAKQNKIKVLHIIATNFIGGPENQILNHLEYCDKDKYQLHIGSYIERGRGNEFLDELDKRNVPYLKINQRFVLDFSIIPQIVNYIKQNQIDVLITHGYKSNILGSLARLSVKVPQAMYVRGWTAENIKIRLYNAIEKLFLSKADIIITVARRKAKELEASSIPGRKIRYISNAVKIPSLNTNKNDDLWSDYGIHRQANAIIAAGRLSPEKGHDILLKALYILKNRRCNYHCIIFGDGPLREQLEIMSGELNINDRLTYAGFVQDWKKYLGENVLLINPSHSEVMPNVVLEGLAYRCPVLATDVGGVNELIINGKTGYLIPPGDPGKLAEGVVSFIEHRSEAKDLIENGWNHVRDNFSFESQARALEAVYEELYAAKAD